MKIPARQLILAAALFGMILLSGCATEETENASARPWNTPKTWESGLPSVMTEGR